MAVLLGQLAVHIDEPQYETTNPLHGIICDQLRRHLLIRPNQEVCPQLPHRSHPVVRPSPCPLLPRAPL